MKHFNFKIIDVKHIKADDKGCVSIWCHRLNKLITLPYPEFCSDCIVLLSNPIDIYLSSGYESIGKYSIQENSRTMCFIYPYSEDSFEYWKRVCEDMDDWHPFFPEQKEVIYRENDISIHFYKHISFNKDWKPVSYKLYIERQLKENPDNYYMKIDRYEEIEKQDYEYNYYIDEDDDGFDFNLVLQRIATDSNAEDFRITYEGEEYNDATSGYDVYAIEYYGDIDENKCQDECWACYRILEKECLYLIEVATKKEGHHFYDYSKEVWGDSVDDALDQMFCYIADTEKRKLYPYDIIYYRVYHNDELINNNGSLKSLVGCLDKYKKSFYTNVFNDEIINNICTNVCYFTRDGYECIEKLRGKYNKESAEMIYCYILGENYAVANSHAIKAVDFFTREFSWAYDKRKPIFVNAMYQLVGLFVNESYKLECGDESYGNKINSLGVKPAEMASVFIDEYYSPYEDNRQKEARKKHWILCFLSGIRHVFADKLDSKCDDDEELYAF